MPRDADESPGIIRLASAVTAVRLRPNMYVGPLDRPDAILTLLAEGLCLAMDGALSGLTRQIEVTLHREGFTSVRDDGPGPDVSSSGGSLGAIENLLTEIYACRQAKKSDTGKSLCGAGIVVTNALSEWLTFETVQEGWLWRQRFVRGEPEGPMARVQTQDERWHRLTFLPDREFFGKMRLTAPVVREWFAGEDFDLPRTKVTLVDQVSAATFDLNLPAVS